jgi:hypothetical protein
MNSPKQSEERTFEVSLANIVDPTLLVHLGLIPKNYEVTCYSLNGSQVIPLTVKIRKVKEVTQTFRDG